MSANRGELIPAMQIISRNTCQYLKEKLLNLYQNTDSKSLKQVFFKILSTKPGSFLSWFEEIMILGGQIKMFLPCVETKVTD